MVRKASLVLSILLLSILNLYSQTDTIVNPEMYYSSPQKYKIEKIKVDGIKYLDEDVLIQLSGLSEGDEIFIPSDKITKAVKQLYGEGLFSDVKVIVDKIVGDKVFLRIFLQERPRLSSVNYIGFKKNEKKKIKKILKLKAGNQVSENLIANTKDRVKKFFTEKGFYNVKVKVSQRDDKEKNNSSILDVEVSKKNKIKISNVFISGNKEVKSSKLKRSMKKTREKSLVNIFKSAKFIKKNFEEDKFKLLEKYNELGYRDAVILSDSVISVSDKRVNVYVNVKEGSKYYFNNINWIGNTVYPSELLSQVLKIKKGDVYDSAYLNKRLKMAENSVQSIYLDNGYLFCDIIPVETVIGKDSINLELRVLERQQAKIDRIIIKGNHTTHEHVVRRELYTYPGELFSRTKIINSVRELSQMGNFDPQQILPTPKPNMDNGTVDIEYSLVEKSNDQIELSGGWGAGMLIGSVGLKLSNFSIRNISDFSKWKPIPRGDGQTLRLRAQTNGKYYSSFSFSFLEPWLGGKKRNSLSTSIYYTHQTGYASTSGGYYGGYGGYGGSYGGYGQTAQDDSKLFDVIGGAVGLGRRLKWPDNWFTLYNEVSYQHYKLKNWKYYIIRDGEVNNLNFSTTLSRKSINNPLYPTEGSDISLKLALTPPYSLFTNNDLSNETDREKYKWIEYHKWNFKSKFYTKLSKGKKNLVLYTGIECGFLGYYNKDRKSPFEGFSVGGDGMSGYSMYGTEYVKLRGYTNSSLTALNAQGYKEANLYSKMTMELRYPLSLAQQATIYILAFAEAGNSWNKMSEFQPFDLYRSAGVGVRIFLPMFGLLGIDWGYGFDDVPTDSSANHGQFSFVLGREF